MADENGNGIEVRGPKGISIRTRGQWAYLTVVILLCCGFVAYLVWDHARDQIDAVKALAGNQKAILEAQQETTYVLTLTPEEREKLNLRMPDSLRQKIRQ